jgi:hypothetical protein
MVTGARAVRWRNQLLTPWLESNQAIEVGNQVIVYGSSKRVYQKTGRESGIA